MIYFHQASQADYICCTHVDDFKIVAKDCEQYMVELQKVYLIKHIGPPDYYLGNDYMKSHGQPHSLNRALRRRNLGSELRTGRGEDANVQQPARRDLP